MIASIEVPLTDAELLALRDRVVQQVTRVRARGLIIDVTGLDVIDSFAAHTLGKAVEMVQGRGAQAVIVGIQPEVAIAMVQVGLTLDGTRTAVDREAGLDRLNPSAKLGLRHAR